MGTGQTSLARILKQSQPFHSAQQEAYLSIVRTAAELSRSMDQLLRPFEITQPQYNVLRILLGAGPAGLGRNEIRERMVTAMPDVTRLLDRMEKLGWLTRVRSEADRRHVPTTITAEGKALLRQIEGAVRDLHVRQFRGIGLQSLEEVLAMMDAVRNNLE